MKFIGIKRVSFVTLLLLFLGIFWGVFNGPGKYAGCYLFSRPASAAVPSGPARRAKPPASLAEEAAALVWHHNLNEAASAAAVARKPVLLFFSSPECGWCAKLKREVLQNPEIKIKLSNFVLAEINAWTHREMAARYQVSGVPAVIFLYSNGRVIGRINGYTEKLAFSKTLTSLLHGKETVPLHGKYREILDQALKRELAYSELADLMIALGKNDLRTVVHDRLLSLETFPAARFLYLLDDQRLAVRLGALEILEEMAGDDFGFDPWTAGKTSEENREALSRWQQWAKSEQAEKGGALYTALTQKQVARYLNDLVSPDRQRAVRAMRSLKQGGAGTLQALKDFTTENPDLPTGIHNRIREVKYSVLIGPKSPENTAHHLVFGSLDARLKALRSLEKAGEPGITILKEFLGERDALVRETAIDTLIKAGRRETVPLIEAHLATEKDTEVIITVIRGLGTLRSKRSLKLLVSFLGNPNEDIIIAALQSIAKLKTRMAEADIGRRLGDPRWRVRVAALKCASELELKNLGKKAEPLLDDEDPFVRFHAVRTVSALSGKASAEKLEAVFLEDDSLKGPVLQAFGRIDTAFPDSFAGALENKNADVLGPVIEGLAHCGKRGLPLAAGLAGHPDTDIACGALRILGQYGVTQPEYRKILTEHLLRGSLPAARAVLDSARLSNSERKELGLSPAAPSPGYRLQASEGGGKENFLEELVRAFSGKGIKSGQKPETVLLKDLFAAFLGPSGENSEKSTGDGGVRGNGSPEEMVSAAKPWLTHENEAARLSAALFLVSFGNMDGIPLFAELLDGLAVNRRLEIAESLYAAGDGTLSLAKKMIRDSSKQVRERIARLLLSNAEKEEWLDALFNEIARKNALLQLDEVNWSILQKFTDVPRSGKKLRKRILPLLENETRPQLRHLALFTLPYCWRRGDEKKIGPLLQSGNPYTRRAAYYVLSQKADGKFLEIIDTCASDASEYVRAVVPAAIRPSSFNWVHYFDASHFYEEYVWSRYDDFYVPEAKALMVLETLSKDKSPDVRFQAMMARMSYFEEIDVNELAATLRSLSGAGDDYERQVRDFVERHYANLGPEYRVFLPLFDRENTSKKTLEKIRAHFRKDEPPVRTPTYITRKAQEAAIQHTVQTPSPQNASGPATSGAKTLLVFFSDPGCLECEEADELLLEIKNRVPELVVEKFNLNTHIATRLNEDFCRRFDVPENECGVAPGLFTGAGYLVRDGISFEKISELVHRSRGVALPEWYSRRGDGERNEKNKPAAVKTDSEATETHWVYFLGIAVLLLLGVLFFKGSHKNG